MNSKKNILRDPFSANLEILTRDLANHLKGLQSCIYSAMEQMMRELIYLFSIIYEDGKKKKKNLISNKQSLNFDFFIN